MRFRISITMLTLTLIALACGASFGQASPQTLYVPTGGPDIYVGKLPPGYSSLEAYLLNQAKKIGEVDRQAGIALDQGQLDDAIAIARHSLTLGQNSGVANEVIAQALMEQGKEAKAMQEFAKLAADSNPVHLLPLSLLLLRSGDWVGAVDAYNRALPNLSWGQLMRSHSHFTTDVVQKKELETYLHIAIGLEGDVTVFGGTHQTERSVAQIEQAIKLSPDCALAYYELGWMNYLAGHKGETQAAYSKAIELGTGDVKTQARDGYWRSLNMKDGPVTVVDPGQ